MVRERTTAEETRGQKCVAGERKEEGLITTEYSSFPKRRSPQPDNRLKQLKDSMVKVTSSLYSD